MHQSERGFTLIEVMVALMLTALLLSVVYASMRVGVDSNVRVSRVIAQNEEERALTYFLRSQLLQLETRGLQDSARFSGDADSFRFSVRYLQQDQSLRTFHVKLVQGANGRQQLEIDETTSGQTASPLHAVLLSALEEIFFQYYGLIRDAPQPEWQDNWNPIDGLPQLLRVSYQRAGDPRRRDVYLAIATGDLESNKNRAK